MNDKDITILVETQEQGLKKTGIMDMDAKNAIEKALGSLGWMAEKTRIVLREAYHRPDEAEIEFGIKVGSKAGVLVAQGNVDAHIKAKLVWKNLGDEQSEGDRAT